MFIWLLPLSIHTRFSGFRSPEGIKFVFSGSMANEELKIRINELETSLATKENDYADAIRSHKGYPALRAIRDDIAAVRKELQFLREQCKQSDSPNIDQVSIIVMAAGTSLLF